jgi:hypothetical protein
MRVFLTLNIITPFLTLSDQTKIFITDQIGRSNFRSFCPDLQAKIAVLAENLYVFLCNRYGQKRQGGTLQDYCEIYIRC